MGKQLSAIYLTETQQEASFNLVNSKVFSRTHVSDFQKHILSLLLVE